MPPSILALLPGQRSPRTQGMGVDRVLTTNILMPNPPPPPHPLDHRPIHQRKFTFPFHSFYPFANKLFAVRGCKRPLPMPRTVKPLPIIHRAICARQHALPMLRALRILPNVGPPIAVRIRPISVLLPLFTEKPREQPLKYPNIA